MIARSRSAPIARSVWSRSRCSARDASSQACSCAAGERSTRGRTARRLGQVVRQGRQEGVRVDLAIDSASIGERD